MPAKSSIILPSGTQVPDHIAIIPDGNRRWARARGLHTLEGHRAGFKRVVELARVARSVGVHTITIWGFSTENWDRTETEIKYLMKLYKKLLNDYLKDAHKEEVRIVHIGRRDRLPKFLLDEIDRAQEDTKQYKRRLINIAIDYGGKDEIVRATQKIINDKIAPSKVTEQLFEKYLDTHDEPYPYADLLIRTSGEQRTSGLLLWQASYAELYWDQDHLPDFTPQKLVEAILDYSRRRRRFGGNDAMEHLKFRPTVAAKFELAWWRLQNIPEGTKFSEYAIKHMKEQFGLSTKLAKEAAYLMAGALLEGKQSKWHKAGVTLRKFYKLIRDEVKLAFEPSIAASLEIKLWQKMQSGEYLGGETQDLGRTLIAETYRISDFQAAKAAHLRLLASRERDLAQDGQGEGHWKNAEDYLEKYYKALKDRVA